MHTIKGPGTATSTHASRHPSLTEFTQTTHNVCIEAQRLALPHSLTADYTASHTEHTMAIASPSYRADHVTERAKHLQPF